MDEYSLGIVCLRFTKDPPRSTIQSFYDPHLVAFPPCLVCRRLVGHLTWPDLRLAQFASAHYRGATLSINDYVWLLNYGRSWPCICVGRGDLQQKQHNPSSRDCGHHATCAGHPEGPFVLALTSLLVGDLVEAVLEHLVQMHRLIVFRHFKSHTRTHTLVHGHSKKYNFKRDSSRYPSHSIRIEHLPCCHYTSAIAEH